MSNFVKNSLDWRIGMGSREIEIKKTKQRLAAKAFLTNISLSGSYKDGDWELFHSQGIFQNGNAEGQTDSTGGIVRSSGHPHSENGQEADFIQNNDLVPDSFPIPLTRIRSNTGNSSEASFRSRNHRRFVSESEGGYHPRHAHFSSAESVDHGRTRQLSTSNVSECSSSHPKELKMLNLRDNPLPTIRDERLIIMLSRRTPFLIFSALPYARNPRHTRSNFVKVIMAFRLKSTWTGSATLEPLGSSRSIERQEASRRTRNYSGTRPLSALSDPALDPLEQLVHNGEEEVSYGYLLLQSTGKPNKADIVMSNGNNSITNTLFNRHKTGDLGYSESVDVPPNKAHHNVSRCVSYDAGVKLHGTCNLSPIPSPPEGLDTLDCLDGSGTVGGILSPIPVMNVNTTYSPHLLDDPEFRAGRHRTLLTFPSYITSVIDYCKASDLKKELNDKFKDRFPHVQLTLSKLRSLKRDMRRVAKSECNVDVLTVAQAYVYFEKLILASFVTKFNRKLCSGACLLLSAKLNDVKGENLHNMIEKIETTFRVSGKAVCNYEFAVMVALEFNLHLSPNLILPHYQRLLYES